MTNFNAFIDSLLTADDEPLAVAADRRRPRPKPLRARASDGTLLGFDAMPLDEALPNGDTVRAPRTTAPVCFDTPPRSNNQ